MEIFMYFYPLIQSIILTGNNINNFTIFSIVELAYFH